MASRKKNVTRAAEGKDEQEEIQTIPRPNISRVKNKQIRSELYRKMKSEKRKVCLPIFRLICIKRSRVTHVFTGYDW